MIVHMQLCLPEENENMHEKLSALWSARFPLFSPFAFGCVASLLAGVWVFVREGRWCVLAGVPLVWCSVAGVLFGVCVCVLSCSEIGGQRVVSRWRRVCVCVVGGGVSVCVLCVWWVSVCVCLCVCYV
jgi:hypothetical protein